MSSKHLASRLLSGKNRLSRPEKDALLEQILAAPSRRSSWRLGVIAGLAAAAAAVVIVPLAIRRADTKHDELVPRGKPFASFRLACSDAANSTCHRGEKLLFDVQASAGHKYFAAFARREDGAVIWYFPESADGRGLDLGHTVSGVLDRGVILDATHSTGRYDVYGVFSELPLSRDELKARFRPGATDIGPGTAVVKQELTVQ